MAPIQGHSVYLVRILPYKLGKNDHEIRYSPASLLQFFIKLLFSGYTKLTQAAL